MSRLRVYLAGPINGCSDSEMSDWREELKCYLLSVDTVDPTDRDYRGIEDLNVAELVEADKADIDSCDIVVAHTPRPSVGTSMEILYAWERGKHVIIYTDPSTRVSPWLTYHSQEVLGTPQEVAGAVLRESVRRR